MPSLFREPHEQLFFVGDFVEVAANNVAKLERALAAAPDAKRVVLPAGPALLWSESAVALPRSVESLILRGGKIKSLARLAETPGLQSLYCEGTSLIEDITPLGALAQLRTLAFAGAKRVKDARPLATAQALEFLDLDTGITDVAPLANLPALTELYIPKQLKDLKAVGMLRGLVHLRGWISKIGDLAPLAALTRVRALSLMFGTKVRDFSPLASMTALEEFAFEYGLGEAARDFSPLAALTNLRRLNLSSSEISDASIVAAMPKLESLNLADTKVTDLTPLHGLGALTELVLPPLSRSAHAAARERWPFAIGNVVE